MTFGCYTLDRWKFKKCLFLRSRTANFIVDWWNKLGYVFNFVRNCLLVFRFLDDGEIQKSTLCPPKKKVPVFVYCISGVSNQSFMILDSPWVFWRKREGLVMVSSHVIHVSWTCQTRAGEWIPSEKKQLENILHGEYDLQDYFPNFVYYTINNHVLFWHKY